MTGRHAVGYQPPAEPVWANPEALAAPSAIEDTDDPHRYIAGARKAALVITHLLAAAIGFILALIPKG